MIRKCKRKVFLIQFLFTALFALSALPALAAHGRLLEPGLYQLTGTHLVPGQPSPIDELSDPSPPYVNERGGVEIYGSAPYFIMYPSWNEFATGGEYQIMPLDIRLPDGTPLGSDAHLAPWDLRKYRVIQKDGRSSEILVGGAMSPTGNETLPVWPKDNWTRRIFIFRKSVKGFWIRDKAPLTDPIPQQPSWVGHSYGGNFFQVGVENPGLLFQNSSNPIYFYFEKVSLQSGTRPLVTEIFSRGQTTRLALGIGEPPFPATRRTIGGFLIEGPRVSKIVVEGRDFYIMGFSAGDYPTDHYSINYAWSLSPGGPFHPMLTPDGGDLLDLGATVRTKYALSWVGRPALFRNGDHYEMLFHAVFKSMFPNNDYSKWPSPQNEKLFFRCIFKTRVALRLTASGAPLISMPLLPVSENHSFYKWLRLP